MKRLRAIKFIILFYIITCPAMIFSADANVRINSIGFLPNNAKGFTCNVSGTTFTVVRVSDSAVMYTGSLGGAVTVSDSGETVYKGDFSSFTTAGTYRVNVAGVGNSVDFIISDDVYNTTFVTVERAMYLWRCNTAVSGSFTYNGQTNTFSHAACHMNDAYLDYVTGSHTIQNGQGGWHDAGDYNKYIVNAGAAVGPMFMAWEHFSAQINSLDTGIPNDSEAGQNDSAYPDYLKEMRYEIKYVLRSAYADGTGRVSAKLSALDFDAFEPPEDENEDRFFTSWGSAATADYVAMLAMAARIFYPYDPAYSQTCITAARTAYNYLLANTANVNPNYTDFSTGGYGTTDGDDRLWAAAEMWATTGAADAHSDFQTRANGYTDKTDEDWDWSNMKNLGMYTYLLCTRTGKNATILADIQVDLLADANAATRTSINHGYGRNLGTNYYWGCNGSVARQVMLFRIANMVSPNANYITASLNALGYLLGRNYHRRSYVTDVGVSAPMFPHDRRSGSDGITNPWPGYLVGGSSGARNDDWQLANLVAGLPAALYWSDVEASYSSNEIAINWQAAIIYALAGFIGTPAGTPTFTPTFTRTRTVTFAATATRTITGTPPTATITYTSTQIPTPGVVAADCVQGQTFTPDGTLNEAFWSSGTWTSVTRVVEGTQGAVSARFKVKWDNVGLIVGVEVTDPTLCYTNTTWYNDDSVEIYIDKSNNHSTTYVLGDDFQYSVRYNEDVIMEQNDYVTYSTAATVPISGGYSVEFSIEWDDIGLAAPSAALTLGFDVGVNHDETCGGTRTGVLMWNGTGNNYTNTSAFGDAVLGACAAGTPTFTRTRTVTASVTPTPTYTRTRTATATYTRTRTQTPSASATASVSQTPTYTITRTASGSPSFTRTRTATPTYTRTSTPVNTTVNTPVNTATFTRTVTFTNTPVNTGTFTRTSTPSYTRTSTPVNTPTNTPLNTATFTRTSTPSLTRSVTPADTASASATASGTQTITNTRTPTASVSSTNTYTRTPANTPVNTPTHTRTATGTYSRTMTFTATNTPTFTYTGTPSATRTPSFTRTVTSTFTVTHTHSVSPTVTVTWTGTPPTSTNTPTVTQSWTSSPTDTVTVTETATPTDTPQDTNTATPTVTLTVTRTFTATPTFTRTVTVTFTATSSVTRTHTPVNTSTFTLTATVTETQQGSPTNTPENTASMTVTLTSSATPQNTATGTATPTWTATRTSTASPTASRTSTPLPPTPTATTCVACYPAPTPDVFEIKNPAVFPNPYNPHAGAAAYFTCDVTQDASYIKIKIYTAAYRAVKEINIPGIIYAGIADREIAANAFSGLGAGVYFYTVAAESQNGVKAKAAPGILVIIR